MTHVRLGTFIHENMEAILQAWEDFARTIEPPALTMDDAELRDHARQMLHVIAKDLSTPQSDHESVEKSKGKAKRAHPDSAAEIHAEARLLSGFTVVQLVSEYRALRASVLTLWGKLPQDTRDTDMDDVTRFNEAVDQALAESVARYAQMVKQTQNMFLAILGHDLRNPLGTIVTATGFLMQAVDIPAKYVLVATRMFNSAQRMSRLINDLIDFTRTHLGPGIPVKLKQANLSRVCQEVVDELRTYHPERRIDLSMQDHLDAIFDESRIAQVLSNLIGNAIQYGSGDKPVIVVMSKLENDVRITVNNRGKAIEQNKLAAVFDPFVRIAATHSPGFTERTSLGIGLFIARQIVHAHGGELTVSSDKASGTTFTLVIPLVPAAFSEPREYEE
ncbi:sensor histidine kinase [Massilia sp. PAMC28688]|uniref:sensor histidine kinase n=1 Tax=Massilia sp. PAMC28688 TaxID=2861283 RepID=UPI001C631D94|nr:sensor histidine kinase [Massilia sp. PAMC28688]QYF93404.1 sensor histidine kinase [Massilia sp. PAMC28688]